MTNPKKEWWQSTVIYQVYPRSFADSNGDGIGDLPGIIGKLDYLKDLGVETIWSSPFYASPQDDIGYDISDYRAISPEYGTMADAERLIEEVHRRGMKIVFDMVMNHTSEEHAWFKESRSSRDNPKRNWYIWRKGRGPNTPPNNWKAMIGGCGWQYDAATDEWFWATFLPFQPDLNYHNPEVKAAMFDVVRFWLGKGVDGLRLDIFNAIFKDESFRDNPFRFKLLPSETDPDGFFQQVKYTINHPLNFAFAKELRAVIDEFDNPRRFMVGEVFGPHPTIKRYLGEACDGLNLVFIFETLNFKFTAAYFRSLIETFETTYAEPYTPTIVYSNHDKMRAISKIGGDPQKMRLLALFQLTVRGVPTIYYGEEIGMLQAQLDYRTGIDPLASKYAFIPRFALNLAKQSLNRDECRTPMQWTPGANTGFTTAVKPWLPIHENHAMVNVETESKDSGSLYSNYKKLLNLRASSDVLRLGSLRLDPSKHPTTVLSYIREYEGKKAHVFLNFGPVAHTLTEIGDCTETLAVVGDAARPGNGTIEIGGHSGIVLRGG